MKAPVKIPADTKIKGTRKVKIHRFNNGTTVPMYDVTTIAGFNQIVGFAKFLNRDYGSVYYRGQTDIYPTVLPSAARDEKTPRARNTRLSKLRQNIVNTPDLYKELHLTNKNYNDKKNRLIVESVMQHYGVNTYCLDAVDNHWIALWFGQFKFDPISTDDGQKIGTYIRRTSKSKKEKYQYVILIAADGNIDQAGYKYGNNVSSIDLRKALPSTFLRPHAQHAIMLKKRNKRKNTNWDFAGDVVGILRFKIETVTKWLGEGELLSQKSLFPSVDEDDGYKALLSHKDIFESDDSQLTIYRYDNE